MIPCLFHEAMSKTFVIKNIEIFPFAFAWSRLTYSKYSFQAKSLLLSLQWVQEPSRNLYNNLFSLSLSLLLLLGLDRPLHCTSNFLCKMFNAILLNFILSKNWNLEIWQVSSVLVSGLNKIRRATQNTSEMRTLKFDYFYKFLFAYPQKEIIAIEVWPENDTNILNWLDAYPEMA